MGTFYNYRQLARCIKCNGNCTTKWKSYRASRLAMQQGNNSYDAEKIHGISTELAQQDGISIAEFRKVQHCTPKPNMCGSA
jgi:hypothetical protein